jgi:hypothetical protein
MINVNGYDSQAVLSRALHLYWRAVRESACANRDTVRGKNLMQSAFDDACLIGLILGFSAEQVLADIRFIEQQG